MNSELKIHKKFNIKDYAHYVIGADVGGTNTRIGVAGVKKNKFNLLFSLRYSSKNINSLSSVLKHAEKTAKEKFGVKIKNVCLACAGPITKNRNFCEMTNTKWNVDRKKLMKQMKILPLVNDVEAVGHAINKIKPRVKKIIGTKRNSGTKTIITVGTGLGKCTVYKNKVVSSEFGHTEFIASTNKEKEMIKFIKGKSKFPVEYEQVVSGNGLENIYKFLSSSKMKSFDIMKNRNKNPICKKAVNLLVKYCARFARNSALNDASIGGIYIAGGIPSSEPEIFGQTFIKEFTKSKTHQKLLKSIPIFVILDNYIGVKSACTLAAFEVFK